MRVKFIQSLRNLHNNFEREIAIERSRRVPDMHRISKLKKLKLAIKDKLAGLGPRNTGLMA
jgi:hypothetical protein